MKPDKNKILLTLKAMLPELQAKYGVTKIGIFGSVAREQSTEQSDVDIVYEMDNPHLFVMVHLKNELEQALQRPVDLVRYRQRLNPYLKKRIQNEGIYV